MQTFLPYPNFKDSAKTLDYKRLGKQRVENLQIMQRLVGVKVITTRTYSAPYMEPYEIEPGLWIERPVIETEDLDPIDWKFDILDTNGGWTNHPAVKMWRTYESTFLRYQRTICNEWRARGYKDTCYQKTEAVFCMLEHLGPPVDPPWLGDYDFHISHQSNLVRKFPEHYRPCFPTVLDDLPYIWPEESSSDE